MTFSVRLPSPVPPPARMSDLRTAVSGIGLQASLAVDAVRRAFTAGSPPVQTAGSGSAADYVRRFGGQGVAGALVTSTSHLGLSTAIGGGPATPPRPEVDQVDVASSRHVGVGDSFYVRVVASIALSDLPRISQLRLMRSEGGLVQAPVPSVIALEQIPLGNTRKTVDPVGAAMARMAHLGIGNQASLFVRDDTLSPVRSVVSSGNLRPVVASPNTNRSGATVSALLSISNADPSVLANVSFFLTQRSQTVPTPPAMPLAVGRRQGLNVLGGDTVSSSPQVAVTQGNSMGFHEIARVAAISDQDIGDFAEFEFVDPSVIYGRSYTYYVSCLTSDGIEGPRSRLVRADIVSRVPPPPPVVLYSIISGRPRFSVRCSGTFVDHVEVYRRGGVAPELVRILGTDRAMVTEGAPVVTDSGFVHIGDLSTGQDRSSTFVDTAVPPGRAADYRFYTVDAYGDKCQTPFSCSIVMPDHGRRIPLGLPIITAEQGVSPRTVNISVFSDDPRVTHFVVGRRGLDEEGFHQPAQPDKVRLGTVDAKRAKSRLRPILQGKDRQWFGVLSAISGAATMVDTAVGYDRPYQYSVVGVDVRGNRTSPALSQILTVGTKPVADRPVALTCSIDISSTGRPSGVVVEWNPGTSDFSPNDLIGDQDVLAATSVRTVYQVERREIGSPKWEIMPATTGTAFFDEVSLDDPPPSRPPYARIGREYQYRVIAMQSGGYVSPHTDPVGVVVGPLLDAPSTIYVRSTPLSIRPVQIIVSWNYDGDLVDGWEIDRAVTNKAFGAKIVSMDSAEARSLVYSRVASVMVEASAARAVGRPSIGRDPTVFVGNRFFVDTDVDPANSYFYRVRALDVAGRTTAWTYGGIHLTDSPHDRKFYSTLSDGEKSALSRDPRPISSWRPR